MTSQIVKLFAVIVLLFALLIGWTSRWTVFQAGALDNNQLNVRTLIDQLRIKRGRILADDDEKLAISVPAGQGTWTRRYPTGSLFAQPVGYSTAAEGDAAGLELSLAPELRGEEGGLSSVFGQFGGTNRVGDDVETTLDPKAQQAAVQGLAGRAGSVVALDPKTGAVLAMYANPSYDDNHPHAKGSTTFNRSTQGQYPQGSNFKVVTATAAIDSGKYTPN
jgi:penicillin-binding protein A